jgi:Domain of unknown function (DUF4276)
VSVKLYVEGGGDSKEQHIRCREGFSKLIQKSGFDGRMPRIVACGGRGNAYDQFKTAATALHQDADPILLVDSEDPVTVASPWQHLKDRDGWIRPEDVQDDQAQLMVTCMETWIMADRVALQVFFGRKLRLGRLLPDIELEMRSRQAVQQALEDATEECGVDRAYRKGTKSFRVLAELNPATLKPLLPYFKRFLDTLDRYL